MPLLYDPDDSDFDVGEYASFWSYPHPNIGAESNGSRVTRSGDRTATGFSSSAQTYRPANSGPPLMTSAQDPRQDVTTLARSILLILDATSATSRQPNEVNPLAAHPPTLRLSTAETRYTIIDATGPTSCQPRQVMPTTVNSPRLTSGSVERAMVPMHRRMRTPMIEGNALTQREQYQEAKSQQVIERWLIRRERPAQLQAEQISGENRSAEHHREENDGAGTVNSVDNVKQSTARE
jgi:hypothetical protein